MKAVLTIILIFFFGSLAMAQNQDQLQKVNTISKGVVLYNTHIKSNQVQTESEGIAVVFKFRNSLIKHSLTFTTVKQRSRLV